LLPELAERRNLLADCYKNVGGGEPDTNTNTNTNSNADADADADSLSARTC
jgi:hypothetical protein